MGGGDKSRCECRNPLHGNDQSPVAANPLDVTFKTLEDPVYNPDPVSLMILRRIVTQIFQADIPQFA